MGKRAASKPKAASGKAKAAAKKAKTGTAAPLAPAPGCWGRPQAPTVNPENEGLSLFLVDIEDGPAGTEGIEHELRLYCLTSEGNSVCARILGMRPYFYARCSPELKGHEEQVKAALEAALPASLRSSSGQPAVLKVEIVKRTPVLVYQPEDDLLCITVAGPRLVSACAKVLEQGVRLPQEGLEVQSGATFEANVALILRFLVDHDLGGGCWLQLAAGAFRLAPEPRCTSAQLELELHLVPGAERVRAIPVDTEAGSAVPPLRSVALEVIVDSESHLNAAACVLTVQGEAVPRVRAVWLRKEAATAAGAQEWESVRVEDYDPKKAEAPRVFCSEDEETLLEHLGETLALIDADIILTYDLPEMVRGLLGKKAVAKSGSALAKGLCRRLTSELKMTAKSNEVSGFAGRLGFDLQKQVEKDHRLTDYSLGALSEHFSQTPLPEVREATLTQLLSDRPCAFAQHVLRQAEATTRIFDRLAYLYNFIEMARVTGCPMAYLLERGQAVKVQTQLLQEARRRAFVLPSQRPGTGEESTFEGATVLEPSCGFYRSPVAVLDFASLYPSIMMAHNLCYSTLLPPGREKRPDAPVHSVAPAITGAEQATCFVKSEVRKGLLPSILERLLAARKAAKKQLATCSPEQETQRKVLNGRQLALKLSANSVYGFTGAMNGPLPCLEVAGAVTAYGREMIQATKSKVESHFVKSNGFAHDAEVVYGDTDSVMVRFGTEELSIEEATRLSEEASSVCSAAFPPPVRLEFEKVYRPFLLMAKKRYAGLAFASPGKAPALETKGIETVRRDWCDLVRQGLDQTLHRLLREDGADGSQDAITYVRGLCDDLRQNKIDFRSLVISKSLGRNEYAAKAPHVEVAEKLRKRDPQSAPRLGDRVSYLVLAGAAKSKVYERAEDPIYALEHELPVDAEYYLENQLKQPLIRVFEQVCGDVQKAESALFGGGAGQKVVLSVSTSKGGMGKFMKARPKCLACNAANAKGDGEAFCANCEASDVKKLQEVKEACIGKAQQLRQQLQELRSHCAERCSLPSGQFGELPADPADSPSSTASHESCANLNCQVIFRRVRVAKEFKAAQDALARLKVTDW